MTCSAPARFPGTPEEREANRRTHWFDPQFDRCVDCDCRPWGRIAEWPCGTRVPRVEITQPEAQAEVARLAAGAALASYVDLDRRRVSAFDADDVAMAEGERHWENISEASVG